MADISSITLPGGGTYDLKDKNAVPKYGMGKNLLRNWYFVGGGTGRGVFPVNQRGQSSYTGAIYGIDRWFVDSTLATITLSASGVSITSPQNSYFTQYLSNSQQYAEKTLTFTVWSSGYARMRYNINGTWNLDGVSPGISTVTFTLPSSVSTFGVQFGISGNSANTFYAVKLELGTEQTLCHNEGTAEDPVWILNEIPDYEYELYRCITSTADPSDTYANKSLATEQQLAYVETGTTASRNYTAGQYISLNGLLYTADTNIASGATFYTSGGNKNLTECVGGGLNSIGVPSELHYYTVPSSEASVIEFPTAGNAWWQSIGKIVLVNVKVKKLITGNTGNARVPGFPSPLGVVLCNQDDLAVQILRSGELYFSGGTQGKTYEFSIMYISI